VADSQTRLVLVVVPVVDVGPTPQNCMQHYPREGMRSPSNLSACVHSGQDPCYPKMWFHKRRAGCLPPTSLDAVANVSAPRTNRECRPRFASERALSSISYRYGSVPTTPSAASLIKCHGFRFSPLF
jgi:hypothetical protein